MRAHELDAPRPLPETHPSGQPYAPYPQRFHDLLAKLLSKDPGQRPGAWQVYCELRMVAEEIDAAYHVDVARRG